ncbi:MAG: NAD(P)/FAD-dependent oxidoreductase [Thermoguttaceae bacterium]|jgi:protoporphyrinogen oxidase
MTTAIIIGAGPAGLTAAYELLQRSDIVPVVLEMTDYTGGISRTANYKGNRIDIGGHRFFSKSDRVMEWWLDRMPMEKLAEGQATIDYQRRRRQVNGADSAPDPETADRVMLLRPRKSRIYFLRRFFDYPIQLSADTVRKLGMVRMARIGLSYLRAMAFPFKPPKNLEEFFINRFGRELYRTFFKSYTEKVWGQRCSAISAEWGAQRVKGLSVLGAIRHVLRKLLRRGGGVAQKGTETSLIEQFLYPKHGPGQMWEIVAAEVQARGGKIVHHQRVVKVRVEGDRVVAVDAADPRTGAVTTCRGDYFISTMPVRDLVAALAAPVPEAVKEVSQGLVYRDFLTVGLLLTDLRVHDDGPEGKRLIRDNWIYIQEPDVLVGRLQIFNNWSPYMVADRSKVWIGLEYFCYETDDLWKMPDADLISLATEEMSRIGIIESSAVLDGTVIRMPKTYPAYFGAYERFDVIRGYLDRLANLFLVGRNGMHRYNNQDHSMLTAMVAVDNILAGRTDKANIWDVNTEQDYHEAKQEEAG